MAEEEVAFRHGISKTSSRATAHAVLVLPCGPHYRIMGREEAARELSNGLTAHPRVEYAHAERDKLCGLLSVRGRMADEAIASRNGSWATPMKDTDHDISERCGCGKSRRRRSASDERDSKSGESENFIKETDHAVFPRPGAKNSDSIRRAEEAIAVRRGK